MLLETLPLHSQFDGQAEVAQLVERNLAKVKVAGSRPVFRSKDEAPFSELFFSKHHSPGWWNW